MTPLSDLNLVDLARAVFAARGLPFDGEPSLGLTFSGDVVVLGLEGGEDHAPHEECAILARADALEEALRSALWRATLRHEPLTLTLAEPLLVRVGGKFWWDPATEEQGADVFYVSEPDRARALLAGVIGPDGDFNWGAVAATPEVHAMRVTVRSTQGPDRTISLGEAAGLA